VFHRNWLRADFDTSRKASNGQNRPPTASIQISRKRTFAV
jgi:hypothetical protein